MFTLTFVDLENETRISIWQFEKMNVPNNILAFFSARYTIKFIEQEWNKFINELWHINLNMNISFSNWHNSNLDSTKMNFFTSFQFLSRLLTSNHFNLISTLLVWRNGVMWKTFFQLLKMRKMKVSRNIKTKCVTDFLLTVRSSSMKDYTCHSVGST